MNTTTISENVGDAMVGRSSLIVRAYLERWDVSEPWASRDRRAVLLKLSCWEKSGRTTLAQVLVKSLADLGLSTILKRTIWMCTHRLQSVRASLQKELHPSHALQIHRSESHPSKCDEHILQQLLFVNVSEDQLTS